MSRFCTNCGSPLTDEETFCHMCGTPVSSAIDQGTSVLTEETSTIDNNFYENLDNQSNNNSSDPKYSNQMKNPLYSDVNQSPVNSQFSFAGQTDYVPNNSTAQNSYSSQNNFTSQNGYYGQNVNQATSFSGVIPKHGFVEAYKLFWQNYVNFGGRSRRSDYWYVVLWNAIIGFVGGLLSLIPVVGTVVAGILALLEIASLIPMIALSVRRLQDTGRNGLLFLLNLIPLVGQIILFIFYCDDSQQGRNEYGESPKYVNNYTVN